MGPMLQRAETSVCHPYAVTADANAEIDIKWSDGLRAAWSGGLGTTAVVAPAVQRPPQRCYFNVRSKADIGQLNLPHGTDN